MKRTNLFTVRMNDFEFAALSALEASYRLADIPVTKSFLVRYALKRISTHSIVLPS